MITETEYLSALQCIKQYEAEQELIRHNGLTKTDVWVKSVGLEGYWDKGKGKYGGLGTRLFYVLLQKHRDTGELFLPYVEEITKERFLTIRNAGIKSWELFIKLRDSK